MSRPLLVALALLPLAGLSGCASSSAGPGGGGADAPSVTAPYVPQGGGSPGLAIGHRRHDQAKARADASVSGLRRPRRMRGMREPRRPRSIRGGLTPSYANESPSNGVFGLGFHTAQEEPDPEAAVSKPLQKVDRALWLGPGIPPGTLIPYTTPPGAAGNVPAGGGVLFDPVTNSFIWR